MRDIRPLLFRIFYSTSFTVVFLIVLAFIVLTPADAVYQAWQQQRRWDVGVIAGTYILTALLAILIYASRLYTGRIVLQGIPKTYVPIEKEDLPGKRTRKEIVEGLEKNAIIAYKARPRFEQAENDSPAASARISAITQPDTKQVNDEPTWGTIAHPGWSSPASPDLPNLHYDTIIAELPDLIEAKAVSLAPTNPLLPPQPDEVPLPVEHIVEILQRPLNMGLRDYIAYLDSLELINPPTLGADFLSLYERARFSAKPLHEPDFRKLMSIFASILRGMTKLNPDLIAELQTVDLNDTTADWRTPAAWSPKSASTFSVDDTGSVRHSHYQPPPRRISEDSVPSLPTEEEDNNLEDEDEDVREHAPSLPTAPLQQPHNQSRTRPTTISAHSLRRTNTRSSTSIASRVSTISGAGSVIRLAEARTELDLPYVIEIPSVPDRRR